MTLICSFQPSPDSALKTQSPSESAFLPEQKNKIDLLELETNMPEIGKELPDVKIPSSEVENFEEMEILGEGDGKDFEKSCTPELTIFEE